MNICAVAMCVLPVAGCVAEPDDPAASASWSSTSSAPAAMKPRVLPAKPATTVQGPHLQDDEIIVKFKEGTRVRLRSGALRFDPGSVAGADQALLARHGLAFAGIASDVSAANALLASARVGRHFGRPEAELEREQALGESNLGEELADLNLYFHVRIDPGAQAALLDRLNALDSVELAYAPPKPEDAWADLPPATPSYTWAQDYVNAAPIGIDARYARTVQGGAGLGVKVIDVEVNWNLDHEDAPTLFTQSGTPLEGSHHGTAVAGVIAAVENGYGMTGAASDVKFGIASARYQPEVGVSLYSVAHAVSTATGKLSAGDVILIEQHARGPVSGLACACNCNQFEYIPMEYWQAEFDAMKAATALGVIVVEAGGNGSMNLNAAIYNGAFNPVVRHSGAIIVGAGGGNGGRAATCWTNYGTRVDLQGWGDSVATLGYGSLAKVNGEGDDDQWYTSGFSGTSAASPIVVSAVADVQGARIAHGLGVATPAAMRALLVATGTPQVGIKKIGPLPNLRAALDSLGIEPRTEFVWTAIQASLGNNYTTIDHPATNNNPDAVIQVTHNWGGSPGGIYDNHALGVSYTGSRWLIFHQDFTPIPVNAMYNVVVGDGFVHRATPGNTSGHLTWVDNPYANGNPNAILIVTPNWNPDGGFGVYNNHPIGVWYNGFRWAIYNEDLAAMPANAAFNVTVSPHGSFTHVATSTFNNFTNFTNPLAAPASAHVLITHNYGPHYKYNPKYTGVYYGFGTWAAYVEDLSPMIPKVTFNAFVANAPRATW